MRYFENKYKSLSLLLFEIKLTKRNLIVPDKYLILNLIQLFCLFFTKCKLSEKYQNSKNSKKTLVLTLDSMADRCFTLLFSYCPHFLDTERSAAAFKNGFFIQINLRCALRDICHWLQ